MKYLKCSLAVMVLVVFSVLLRAAPMFTGYELSGDKLESVVFTVHNEEEEQEFYSLALAPLDLSIDDTKIELSADGRVLSISTKKAQKVLSYKFWLTNEGEVFCFGYGNFASIKKDTLSRLRLYIDMLPENPMLIFTESGEAYLNVGKLNICLHEMALYKHLAIDDSQHDRHSLLGYIVQQTWIKQMGTTQELKDSTLAMGIWQLWRYFVLLYKTSYSQEID